MVTVHCLSLDWTPVPIVPKFVKIVVNKILSREPYPKVEAIDPVSMMEKERERDKIKRRIQNKDLHKKAKDMGLGADFDIDSLPETEDEADIFMNANLKTAAESVAQLAINLTLSWNDFNEKITDVL